jgi:16S rRNA (adenine1518-N6/adenine1519-N6)-dimethyltransferase
VSADAGPALSDLPSLKVALQSLGVVADKRFGQHFLFDLNVCRKIVRNAGVGVGDTVVEVGPGPGGLTRALAESGADIIAIERDARFLPLLEEVAARADGRLRIVHGDALEIDEQALLADRGAHLVSNLPYNVGTPLLMKWLLGPWRPLSLTLMFQKEVADRLVALPGRSAYGRLSVIAQILCDIRTVMDLPARAFTPPPKVDSAVIRALPLAVRPDEAELSALQSLTAAAFGQRRKMLRASLRAFGGASLCESIRIDPSARAETLPPEAFLALTRAWRKTQGD